MIGLCVTSDVAAACERAVQVTGSMGDLPSYAAMRAREGGPALVAGDEDAVVEILSGMEAAGVTDLVPVRSARRGSDDHLRTEAFIAELLRPRWRQPGT